MHRVFPVYLGNICCNSETCTDVFVDSMMASFTRIVLQTFWEKKKTKHLHFTEIQRITQTRAMGSGANYTEEPWHTIAIGRFQWSWTSPIFGIRRLYLVTLNAIVTAWMIREILDPSKSMFRHILTTHLMALASFLACRQKELLLSLHELHSVSLALGLSLPTCSISIWLTSPRTCFCYLRISDAIFTNGGLWFYFGNMEVFIYISKL